MECTLIGGGSDGEYQHGFVKDDGIVIGAVKNVLYTEAVECNIKLINSIYNQPRPITDDSMSVMDDLITVTRSMIHWIN
jgi:hypothetical protein